MIILSVHIYVSTHTTHLCMCDLSPHQVVGLEEEWGTYLCGRREYETAIVHLIEAG